MNIFWQAADGTGTVERLTRECKPANSHRDFSDGTRLVLTEIASTGDLMNAHTGQEPSPGTAGTDSRL